MSAKANVENERKSNANLLEMISSLKSDLEEKNKIIEELKHKIKISSSASMAERGAFW